ncbi:MAG: fumarylacetoacetate hydrolase family protein [Oscillospiraceae bacterium]|nr:fumarylacetoacetate hydrolase family protein [Oscillospiraceae bacterium]
MRFYTLADNEGEFVAVSYDGGETLYDLEKMGYCFVDMNDVIASDMLEQLQEAYASRAALVDMTGVKICAPIPRPRQDMICLGINYSAHAVEAGRFSADAFGGERPATIYFAKRVTLSQGSGEAIPRYEGLVDGLDYECELGVVLGKDCLNVTPEEAESYIFGYTIVNDVSARNLQTRHKQWYRGKSLDGFTPTGPCIVTPDEIGDAHNLTIRCRVNGELRQNSTTAFMMQPVAGAIAELSTGMTLQAGTIIATGTPAGVGMGMQPPCFLEKGDEVACEIENIGCLINRVE